MKEKKERVTKDEKRGRIGVLLFTLLYIAAAGVYFYIAGVKEFMFYLVVLLVLVVVVALTLPRTQLPLWALWGLSLLGLLHALGGGVKVDGDVLYNYVIIPVINQGPNGITLWRFDQFVHPYGTVIASLIVYYFLACRAKMPHRYIAIIAALAAMGLGSLNEVIEFATKLAIPHTNVGGYDNTALDLCANLFGSSVGAFIGTRIWKKPPTA